MRNYEELFIGYDVPEHLKSMAINVIKRFTINGCCDGMYICNVVADQNNMGDGFNHFNGKEHVIDRTTAVFLQNAYRCNIMPDEVDELLDILNGRVDTYMFKRGLERSIKRFKDEKRRCNRVYDDWRIDYLNKCIKSAREVLTAV